MPDIPHVAFPFERGTDGKLKSVEQDTREHVASCENVIVRCPIGFRVDRPEFGIPWPEFHTAPVDASAIETALRRQEPRSQATASEIADALDPSTRQIRIEVS